MIKPFLRDIKSQNLLTRQIMFGLCVVITVSMVGTFWFRSIEEQLFVTLNPEPEKQEEFYAKRHSNDETIFANVGSTFSGLTAAIGSAFEIFLGSGNEVQVEGQDSETPYQFPISEER